MKVRVAAYAALRELLGGAPIVLEIADGARVRDAWDAVAARHDALGALSASTRVARNGAIARFDDVLADGDELALLPPVGGG